MKENIMNLKIRLSLLPLVLLALFVLVSLAGCGKKETQPALTTAETVDQTSLIEAYTAAYENVDYRKMWSFWPAQVFGTKVSILADMKKDIFRNYYSSKAALSLDRGEITAGEEEDKEKLVAFFSMADIRYVTDVYKADYRAVVTGGKRDGELYKEGTIYAFRHNGKWYVFDD